MKEGKGPTPGSLDRISPAAAGVGLDLLRTFTLAAGSRTFSEAGRRKGVSTSAISQQIRTLESQLGIALFERTGRGARLTEEGRALHRAIEDEFTRIETALDEAVAGGGEVRGPVAIGAPRTFATHWLRPRLVALLETYPDLRLSVDFASPADLERRVVEGDLDLALLARPARCSGLVERPVQTEELVAVASTEAVERVGHLGNAADLRGRRYLAFDRDRSMLSRWWRAHFGRSEDPPERVVCQVRSIEELGALATAGMGIAVLPRYAVADALDGGLLREIAPTDRRASYVVFLAWRVRAPETGRLRAVRDALS